MHALRDGVAQVCLACEMPTTVVRKRQMDVNIRRIRAAPLYIPNYAFSGFRVRKLVIRGISMLGELSLFSKCKNRIFRIFPRLVIIYVTINYDRSQLD